MKYVKLFGLIVGLAGLGVILGISLNFISILTANGSNASVLSASGESSPPDMINSTYEYVPFETMVKDADAVVAGEVLTIGETRWNQDNGEYWEQIFQYDGYETIVSALPYYEITMSIDRLIADSLGIKSNQLVITVIGTSPRDAEDLASSMHPKDGDEIVAFVRQGEIGWFRGEITYDKENGSLETGRKATMLFMGGPDNSHLLRNQNGLYYRPSAEYSPFPPLEEFTRAIPLEELVRLVQEKRTTPQ